MKPISVSRLKGALALYSHFAISISIINSSIEQPTQQPTTCCDGAQTGAPARPQIVAPARLQSVKSQNQLISSACAAQLATQATKATAVNI